jgi:hypothetical protein
MTIMGRVLQEQGETDTPTLFAGWARLFYSQDAPRRQAAIQAFDAQMEILDQVNEIMGRLKDAPPNAIQDAAVALAHQGGEAEPSLFAGWYRLFHTADAAKREAAHEALEVAMHCHECGGKPCNCAEMHRNHNTPESEWPNWLLEQEEEKRKRKRRTEEEEDSDEEAVEPPMLMDALAQKTHPMPVDLEFANTRDEGPAAGKLVQGGTCGSHKGQILKAALKYHGYDFKDTGKFGVILFGKDGGTDAANFNGKVFDCSLRKDAGVDDFEGTNIVPVNLGDPTPKRPWGVEQLGRFYEVVDLASLWLKQGKTVIVACVAGANRSVGVCRALQPNDSTWPAPACPSMDAAAAGWRAGRDLRIAPLAPPPKLATTRAGASRS